MRNLVIYLIVPFLFLSCKKDEVVIEPTAEERCAECVESFVDEFSAYEASFNVAIRGHAYCGISTIYQNFYFKKEPHSEVDGKFFYKTMKKTVYDYTFGAYEVDWTPTDGYFRYDYEAKIAYQYVSLEDVSPLVLMDFNRSVGDSILLDNSSDKGEVYVVVTDISEIFIDGIPYPKMIVDLVESSSQMKTCVLTPYYPNPIIFDNELAFYFTHDWDESNLSDYYHYEAVYATYFSFQLRNISSEAVLSDAYISAE